MFRSGTTFGLSVVSKTGLAIQSPQVSAVSMKDEIAVFRVGSGHDTHRLLEGRPLILGGVAIPHSRGLFGHSDADVVLHAITDALLGAAGLGDIGDAYPDTDPRWQGADSTLFLNETLRRLNQAGWRVVNVDVIIFAQEPKLGPVKARIRDNLSGLVDLPTD